MRAAALLSLLMCASCARGREVISPTEPDYDVVCVDSTVTDTTRVCWSDWATIVITIENPGR